MVPGNWCVCVELHAIQKGSEQSMWRAKIIIVYCGNLDFATWGIIWRFDNKVSERIDRYFH